jgi:hypothetical protein
MLQHQKMQVQYILAERRRRTKRPHFFHMECFSLLKGWGLISPSFMGASGSAAGVTRLAPVHEK